MDPPDNNHNVSQTPIETGEQPNNQQYPQQGYIDPNQQAYQQQAYPQQGYADPNQQAYPQQGYADPNQQAYQQQAYVDPNQQAYQQQAYVDPNQAYQPNPYGYVPQSGNYSYDYNHLQYHEMAVDQWNTIPCDQSDYSYYWADQQAFEPQKYSDNHKHETKWNDIGFVIAFLVNFVITIGVLIYLVAADRKEDTYAKSTSVNAKTTDVQTEQEKQEFKKKLIKCLFLGLAVGIVVNIVHFVYLIGAPLVYIYGAFSVGVIIALLCVIYPMLKYKIYYLAVFPGMMMLFTVILYCICHDDIKFSAAFLKQTCLIVIRNLTLFCFIFVELVLNTIIGIGFSFMVWLIIYKNLSVYIYIYLILSYYWIIYTIGYIMYVTGAGVGGTWYFLNGTEYFPEYPVWESFKRATTTSLGSSCCAAFWLAVVQLCRAIIRIDASGCNQGAWIIIVIQVIALCILCIIECCFSWINRYALIYCALFGVPYREGCRRFMELSCSKFIDVLFDGSIVSTALTYNLFVFVIGGAFLGFGFGYLLEDDNSYFRIFTCVFALFFTYAIYLICDFPIETICDTLFVCFAEAPEKLKTSANELYENCKDIYGKKIKKRMKKNKIGRASCRERV